MWFIFLLYNQQISNKENVERNFQNFTSSNIVRDVTTSTSDNLSNLNVQQQQKFEEGEEYQRYRRGSDVEGKPQAELESDTYDDDDDDDDDDSDMFMEPMEIEKIEVKPDDEEEKTSRSAISESENEQNTKTEFEPESEPVAASPVREQPPSYDNQHMAQHFFPSFAPIFSLGHSRPPQLYHQDPFYTSKARVATSFTTDYNPFRVYRDNSFTVPISFDDEAISTNILGSGNFGVLRGGTFYNEGDNYLLGSHYSNNGHGRPYFSNPRPQKYSNEDFFSNFRDFAEINTPAKASYSQYIVVYINKNSTKYDEHDHPVTSKSITKPKNIFEQLVLLDQGEDGDYEEETKDSEEEQKKKLSHHKQKLELLKQEKSNKNVKSYYKYRESGKDFLEPLLALS